MGLIRSIVYPFLILLALPLGVGGFLKYLDSTGFFKTIDVDVIISNSLIHSSFMEPLRLRVENEVEAVKGSSLWDIDIQDLSQKVLMYPFVKDVHVTREWPHALKVIVEFKDVKLLIPTKFGKFVPVVEDGSLLETVASTRAPDVPVLRGLVFEKKFDLRKKALELIAEIPSESYLTEQKISEIHYSDREGFWLVLVDKGMRVKLGHNDFAKKFARVGQVLEYSQLRGIEARVIDANLSKKVLVRPRKGP